MVTDIFAHTVGRIDFIGGVVRIELVNLVPSDGTSPIIEPHHAVFVPVEGVLDMVSTLQDLVGKLADAGVVKAKIPMARGVEARGVEAKAATEERGPASKPAAHPTKSPNFG